MKHTLTLIAGSTFIKNIKRSLFIILLLLSLDQYGQGKMGVNLSGSMAFVNVMDEGPRYDISTYDAQGWPTADFTQTFDWRLVAEWISTIDDPEQYRINMSGTYKCSFVGQATVNGWGATVSNKTYDAPNNITTFDITVPSTNNGRIFWQLNLTGTKRTFASATNTGITKLRMNRPGYPLSTTQSFTNEFINLCKSASFACYRYMPVSNAWFGSETYPAVTTWANRKLPTDAYQVDMQSINGKVEGWSWEHTIELANILKKDIWINLNVSVDDNYVTQLATKLQAELDASIHVYIEYGNEVWDPNGAGAGQWLNAQAGVLGISFDQNYARNVVRISNLFKGVYGAAAINNKIRMILGAQQGWMGRSQIHLDYIKNNIGNPKDYIWALAPSTYYSGFGASIELALNECHTDIMVNYDDVNDDPSLLKFMQLAITWGLPGVCVSYEGQAADNIGNTNNLAVDIGKHRDARMATEQYANFQSFFDAGGTLACQYGIWANYTRYGCWGLTDDPTNPDRNFKFKAARTLCGDIVNAMPVPTAPAAPTCLTTTVVSGTEQNLFWVDNATSEDGYEIWSKESTSSTWKYYSTVGPNKTTTNFIHTSGLSYTFRVRAYNFSQWSAYDQPCTVGMGEQPNGILDFQAYPNPVSSELNIVLNSAASTVLTLTISDILSHKIVSRTETTAQGSNTYKLDTSAIPDGMYFVILSDGKQNSVKKIIVDSGTR
jgi:hypothetical protein